MTSLIPPRGSLRRSWGASRSHPRRPCGGGLGGRITAWDAMGYHGITWASINRPGASAARFKRNLHGPLMGCPLKEWLRGNSPAFPSRLRRAFSRASEVPNTGNAGLCSRVVPGQGRLSFFLDGTNPIGGHKMIKTLMISAAVSALMVSGALAQADMSKQPAAKTDAAPHDTTKFIPAQGTDQWVFSKFKGTDVLGPDNAHIGNVSDMLFDKNGKILGLIVGVGGFLGIGEKSVAIDMRAFAPFPADTGSSSGAGGNTTMASRNDDPTMVKLKVSWTKDQLKNAPDFQYYKPPARTTSCARGSPTTGMAPRPITPPAER